MAVDERVHDETLFGGVSFERRREILKKSTFPDNKCPGCGNRVYESIWWSTKIQSAKDETIWDWWHSACLWKKVYAPSK